MEEGTMVAPVNRVQGYFSMVGPKNGAGRATAKQAATEPNAEIAAAFRQAQSRSGLGVGELAAQVPVDDSTVTNWRNGKVSRGSTQFNRACELMGVRPEDILAGRFIEPAKAAPDEPAPVGPVDMFRELIGTRHHDTLVPMIEELYRRELARRDDRTPFGK
jgi:hypothetical protein